MEIKALYDKRTFTGQLAAQKKHFAEELISYPDAPEKPVSASDLIRQQQDILARNGENQRLRAQYAELEQQVQHCIELIEYMNPILEQKILTNLEQNSMIERMDEVLEKAWSLELEKISSVVYEKLCARLMEIPDYEKCGKWAQRSMEQYPGVLSSYTCQLKLFFSNGDKENFFRVMNELKASDITIDKETLELIRIFM